LPFHSLPNRSLLAARLGWLLLGTLATTLVYPIAPLPAAHADDLLIAQSLRQRQVVLGVVHSSENADQWQQITARLQTIGSTYRVIEWEQVQQASDLAPATVLFLPNIETISSEQLLVLQDWMGQGGRLIVSGAVGSQSGFGVQQALRSLLGAYWGFPLSQPSTLEPVPRTMQDWVQQGETDRSIAGGVLIPAGLASRTVVTWGDAPPNDRLNSPGAVPNTDNTEATASAIVTTERTTFLGWQWGNSADADFDRGWLQAAISRYGTLTSPHPPHLAELLLRPVQVRHPRHHHP
jgi:hypothetical protein